MHVAMVQHYPALNPVAAPLCSVCIANFNGVEILGDCIDSVLAQQGSTPVEVIVHDDASTDGSVDWIRRHYPQVELLAARENVGFCVANNRMVARARGEFVLLLNNDAALLPDALQTLVAAARDQASPGICTLPQYDWQSGEPVDRGCLLDPFYNPVPNLDANRRDVAYVIGACMFLPRALWNELGGLPEWLGSLAEDMYLCCLARLRGIRVTVSPGSGYRHRQGASFGGNRADAEGLKTTYRRRALSERNKTAVMAVCTPTVLVWPLLALHGIALAFEGAALSILKWDARLWREVYAPVFGYLVGNFRALCERRKLVQANRRVGIRTYLHRFTWMPRKLALLWRHGIPHVR
jgi:GT2 family glycosyltransferase